MKLSLIRSFGIACLAFFTTVAVNAQEIVISNGGIYIGCGASIVDTGAGPGDYGNNEDITFTVCPDFDAGETVVTIDFAVFNLGSGDYMNIYQGTNSLFPLQGTYTGFELNGQFATAADDNPTGCLTVQFVSDGAVTGNFAFVVSCGPPCERPEAVIDAGGPNPILVCVGEEITFDGNPSIFADGTSLASYNWTFGDGEEDNTSGMIVNHSYDTPGEYRVQLYLTDDNDCNSINLPDVQILVGTTPSFEGTTTDLEICLGQNVDLNGVVTGTLWNGLPENPIGGYLEIPDDQSQCFSSEIVFSNFAPNTLIDSPSDVDFIFVNMEHSFMGDLAISVICPNGQAMVLHQQGGSGTFLGEPNDPDVGMEIQPGIGYDYFWAPDATNGTWAAESGGGTLASGTYTPVQAFDALFGCPLNGTWTLEICDLWGADNGVVFDWTMQFDPSLYPEITEFTPVYGAGCDSSLWSGPYITTTSPDCNDINVTPTDLGLYSYTYSATDNHGCTYDQVVVVNVVQGPIAAVLTPELSFCGDPVQMSAFVSNPSPGASYIYSWSPSTGLSNPNSASTFINTLSADQVYTVTVYEEGAEVCGSEISVNVTFVPPLFSTVNATICEGEAYTLPDGSSVTEANSYEVTIQSVVTGCDSVITTNLDVAPISEMSVNEFICGGEPVVLPDGSLATSGGVYTTILSSQVSGCDSTIVTNVTEIIVTPGDYPATCDGNFAVFLSGTSTPAGGNLSWNGPAAVSFSNPNAGQTNATASAGGSYTVSLTDDRCPADPVSTQLTMRTPPTVELNPIGSLCLGESSILTAQVTGSTTTPFSWSDDLFLYTDQTGASISVVADDFVDIVPVEAYEIMVTVPGLAPCPSAQANILVEVINCEILVPNIFTPNGDGNNDAFVINGIENFPGSRMVISNRWGKVVYESDSYGSPFWNGDHYKTNRKVDDGVYYYVLELSKLEIVEKGTVTVLVN